MDIRNYALIEIEKALLKVGRSLREFQSMSFPLEEYFEACQNKLVMEELSYDRENLARDHAVYVSKFNDEQHHVEKYFLYMDLVVLGRLSCGHLCLLLFGVEVKLC